MELYGQKEKSIPQKLVIIISELILLWISYDILFEPGGNFLTKLFGLDNAEAPIERRIIIFGFSIIVFLRFAFMMMFLLKRKIPPEECISVPFAFALYYLGFSLFVLTADKQINYIDYICIIIFVTGSFLNTYSELQRHYFKKDLENKGLLYTKGLFKYSMHINYFGDLLWVTAYAMITRNMYSFLIPLFLFCFFVFFNIPKLDEYLSKKYSGQFTQYKGKTKKLIPFIY